MTVIKKLWENFICILQLTMEKFQMQAVIFSNSHQVVRVQYVALKSLLKLRI